MTPRRLFRVLLPACALAPSLLAQTTSKPLPVKPLPTRTVTGTAIGQPVVVELVEDGDAILDADVQDPKVAAAQVQEKPDPRPNLLRQAQFDRRRSTILAAWSQPEPLAPDADPELALPPAVEPGQAPVPEVDQKRAEIEQKRAARDLEILSRHVTLGRWPAVGEWFAGLDEKERAPLFLHLLRALQRAPQAQQRPGVPQVPPNFQEQNSFGFDDLLGLAAAAPGGLQKDQLEPLAQLASRALEEGRSFEDLAERLVADVARPEGERSLSKRDAARLLVAMGQEAELGPFLPTAADAVEASDREALNLLARYHVAVHARDGGRANLERAWEVTQLALAAGEISDEDKADALRRAVSLAPRIRAEFGAAWLEESFTSRPERGREILATIGTQASRGQQEHAQDQEFRLEGLRLQRTAVDALLDKAPERAAEWSDSLQLLAANWLVEARHSELFSEASSRGPVMQQDQYGNIFYVGGNRYGRAPVAALEPGALLEVRPEGVWLDMLEESVRPELAAVTAKLLLKVGEEEEAFPYIEALAESHPKEARQLADEFVDVWIRNNDPNSERNRTSSYMFSYGYNLRANGIPLTRSKQERNLKSLAAWVARLRALPIDGLDESKIVRAFVSSHSVAEVYKREAIEAVFGDFESQEPDMLAELAQAMRQNLASVWRQPRVQEAAKTNRKQKDIEREVLRGYADAQQVLEKARATFADHPGLRLAEACFAHDENEYRRELESSTEFATNRLDALAAFADAAELYAYSLDPESEDDESASVYEHWFYAALGASDVGALNERQSTVAAEIPKIRAAIDALPGEAAERHRSRFANALFTRMGAVNPSVKFRYLEHGFSICGDHPQAKEAQKVFQYYEDLVTEIRLDVRIDGPDAVGHEAPFGLAVDLLHTREIETESGGFAKYLQNQNNQPYAYNYGRPPENYRDKFDESVRGALGETFEVLSVTFNDEKVNSKAAEEYGWRRTPYAYVLVKARRPEVDRVPSISMDLDFLDTSGYVVLPIRSEVIPMDASVEAVGRPFADLAVTQILDERKAAEGELSLEIKAQASGLVPGLDQLLDFDLGAFDVVKTADQGVSVTRFGDDMESILSERLFVLDLKPRADAGNEPLFRFPSVAASAGEPKEVVLQRYDDADLILATPEIRIGVLPRDGTPWWPFLLAAAAAAFGFLAWQRRAGSAPDPDAAVAQIRVPEHLTPFTLLAFLDQLRPRLGAGAEAELAAAIQAVEQHYFAESGGDAPDLRAIADRFARRAS
ncbi:MAG: hypothetical protein O3B85_10285 [Planctomycetota bacterium]|nr:hypothetical protein [Planctomycetota bacterium]